MAEESEFAIGASASCSDGVCGVVRRIIIDPDNRTVTHLVIRPKHGLEPAEEAQLVEGPGLGIGALPGGPPLGIPEPTQVVVQDAVPLGETEVCPGDPVHALDGEIGQVQGFLVRPDDGRVTHVLLREGHLWGRKKVAIPISAVTGADAGIWLNLTKKQVGDLPPAG